MTDERPLDEQLAAREDGGVLWLTLNRPEAANAVTPDQRDRLIELLDDASGRLEVRAVVIGATGRHFCTGADLRHSRPGPERPEGVPERVIGDVSRMIAQGAQRLITAVIDCEKPVIGAINGTAAGIGAHLALACDLIVASEDARFIEVFVRRGLVPDGAGAWLLPRRVGLQKAKEMMFFGDAVSAADAERIGLVNRVVPHDEVEKVAGEWAARLAAGPTRSIALTKALLNRSLDSDRTQALREEALAQELNMQTRDANEGVDAFVERRDPDYQGWKGTAGQPAAARNAARPPTTVGTNTVPSGPTVVPTLNTPEPGMGSRSSSSPSRASSTTSSRPRPFAWTVANTLSPAVWVAMPRLARSSRRHTTSARAPSSRTATTGMPLPPAGMMSPSGDSDGLPPDAPPIPTSQTEAPVAASTAWSESWLSVT
jgi:2-(1,2-epoxy-1,2-dihydrophenyl)acetyl-CoA isomerase